MPKNLSKPLSVLQLLPRLNEGGVERGTVEMNREFSKMGIRSIVVSAGGKMVPSITKNGGEHVLFDVCSKNLLTVPFRVFGLRRVFKRYNPDILHARSRLPAWLAFLANKSTKIPFVTTVHGINSVNPYSKIMTSGDQVICVGDPVMHHIRQNYQTNKAKITVIPRGVDMAYFDPSKINNDLMKSFSLDWGTCNKFVIGSIGRISRVKNFEILIDAIAKLASMNINVSGLIIGGQKNLNDSYAASLIRYAEKKCQGRIEWTGSIDDMREAYACCDVVVNASPLMGNVARTLLESLAMNKPIISTAMNGLEHIVKDGLNGFIFETGNTNDLVDKLELAMHLRHADIRSTVPKCFRLETMVRSTIEVYRKALV